MKYCKMIFSWFFYAVFVLLMGGQSLQARDNRIGLGFPVPSGRDVFDLDGGVVFLLSYHTKHFLIEPSLTWQHQVNDLLYDDYTKSVGAGFGFFVKRPLADSMEWYWGAKAGYDRRNRKTNSNKEIAHAYHFAPTLGSVYYLTEDISVGGEIQLSYRKDYGDGTQSRGIAIAEEYDFETESTSTVTQIIFRLYF